MNLKVWPFLPFQLSRFTKSQTMSFLRITRLHLKFFKKCLAKDLAFWMWNQCKEAKGKRALLLNWKSISVSISAILVLFIVFFSKVGILYSDSKGQLISKADWRAIDSPKKRTDEFVLFAFLLFTTNKSNSSVRFFGESTARQSAFRFYLTFSTYILTLKEPSSG